MISIKEKLIAVVGVSDDQFKFGHRIFKSLLAGGYGVYGVNNKGGKILDREIFKRLSDIGKVPDIVITTVKPEVTEKIVEECKALGVKEIWMQPGSESQKAIKLAQKYGITVTHGACIMVESGIW